MWRANDKSGTLEKRVHRDTLISNAFRTFVVNSWPTKEPTQLETVTVGLFLEEIAYFMEATAEFVFVGAKAGEDMERDLWWLLRMAHQPAGPPELIHGDEVIEPVDAAVEAAIQKLKERADKHAEEHVAQVRAKIVIIPSVDKTECDGLLSVWARARAVHMGTAESKLQRGRGQLQAECV
eukprot:s1516_g13.t1